MLGMPRMRKSCCFIGPENRTMVGVRHRIPINGLPSILPTSDRPKGVELRCDCVLDATLESRRDASTTEMALDLGFVEDVQSISQVSSEKRRDGSLDWIRDDDGWYSLTEAGVSFIDAVDDGGIGQSSLYRRRYHPTPNSRERQEA